MTDLKARKKQLLTRLSELDERLRNIEDLLDDAPNPDWEENAIEQEDDEVLESLGASGLAEYKAIRAALDRIKAGTYGTCVKCGQPIEEERLDLLPQTPLCSKCAAEAAA
ncbi:TraR/DksA C4-type zinc finger protein [Mesorhizobium sp. Z1-4]|uniref:TraR/DksA family transcriptional regulator n=1 Tax=Mesorhizobium sp. Z1-4 TaxID=2448478 RepID=UPI000FDCA187|nr:TraR/DksA C4-type zinc finger protein [Mesorhizobium sp. Z1-4]